jgi:hypothetical protein
MRIIRVIQTIGAIVGFSVLPKVNLRLNFKGAVNEVNYRLHIK